MENESHRNQQPNVWWEFLVAHGLRFVDITSERRFTAEFVDSYRRLHQLSMVLGSLLFYIFFLWDLIIDPVNYELTQAIRGLVIVPFGFACVGILQSERLRSFNESIVIAPLILANICLTIIYCILADGMNYGSVGIVLTSFFTFTLLRVRFSYCVLYSVVTLLVFNMGQIYAHTKLGMVGINNLSIVSALSMGLFAVFHRERDLRRKFVVEGELREARLKVEELLYSMLPADIVRRISLGEKVIADSYGEVSIVFADLVGFTNLARKISANQLVETLNVLFSEFDSLAVSYRVEKIKTIGDAYMAISGAGNNREGQAQRAADFAIEIRDAVARISKERDLDLNIRIGLHIGPVVAGVIGRSKPAYDCWGDAVNIASRLEGSARSGGIHISEQAYWRLRDEFIIEQGDDVELKGVGKTHSFALSGRKSQQLE